MYVGLVTSVTEYLLTQERIGSGEKIRLTFGIQFAKRLQQLDERQIIFLARSISSGRADHSDLRGKGVADKLPWG